MELKTIRDLVGSLVIVQRHVEVSDWTQIDIEDLISKFESELATFDQVSIEQAFHRYARIWTVMPRPKDIKALCTIAALSVELSIENDTRALLSETGFQRAN